MKYILPIIPLYLYFELLGMAILDYLKIKRYTFSFGIGLAAFLGAMFIIHIPLVLLEASYLILVIATLSLLIAGLIFIIYVRPKIRINKKYLLIFAILMSIQIFLMCNRTLGDYYANDGWTYFNMIRDIIDDGLQLNNFAYVFQSYYSFAGVIIGLLRKIFNILHIDYLLVSGFSWMFGILYFILRTQLLLIILEKLDSDNKIFNISMMIFWLLFEGLTIASIEEGFIGNFYRMPFCAYMMMYAYDYFNDKNKNYFFLIGLISLSNMAVASNNIMAIGIYYFIFWFILSKYEDILNYLLPWMIAPIFTFGFYIFKNSINSYIFGVVFTILIILLMSLHKYIYIYIQKKLFRKIFIATIFITLTILSISIDKNNILSGFFNNLSNGYDMVWEYNKYNDIYHIIGNIFLLVPIIYSFINFTKNDFNKMLVLMFVLFLSPLQANLLNLINPVFYRSYDILINQFTLILVYYLIFRSINFIKYIMLIVSIYLGFNRLIIWSDETPYVIHKDNFSPIDRMYEDEKDITINMIAYVNYYKINEIKAITYFPLLQSEIPDMNTMYGRHKGLNYDESELTKIFFPVEYNGDPYAPKNPDYNNVVKYLLESDYNFLILDKNIDYSDYEGHYLSIYHKILESEIYPVYENETYAIFHFEK